MLLFQDDLKTNKWKHTLFFYRVMNAAWRHLCWWQSSFAHCRPFGFVLQVGGGVSGWGCGRPHLCVISSSLTATRSLCVCVGTPLSRRSVTMKPSALHRCCSSLLLCLCRFQQPLVPHACVFSVWFGLFAAWIWGWNLGVRLTNFNFCLARNHIEPSRWRWNCC